MKLIYIFLSFFIFLLVIHFVIKMKYGFWYYQPVIHSYDLIRLFKSPQIIHIALPTKNIKYYQSDESIIKTYKFYDIINDNNIKKQFIDLISNHYLKTNHGNVYSPKYDNIFPYFIGYDNPCFFSFYFNPLSNINSDISKEKITKLPTFKITDDIIGAMTSRPLNITLNDKYISALLSKDFKVYYIEFLCVNEMYRKKGIAPQLIQTHEYNQRHINKEIQVSLFKHEDKILEGIVPLCVYKTYGFDIKKYTIMNINTEQFFPYKLIQFKKYNPDLLEFITTQKTNNFFEVFIEPNSANIEELLKTNNLYLFALCDVNKKIKSLYFYKNTCVTINKDRGPILCLSGTLMSKEISDKDFIYGFKKSMMIIVKKYGYDYLSIENISHNDILLNDFITNNKEIVVSPTAYFFYNLIFPTIQSNKFFIFC